MSSVTFYPISWFMDDNWKTMQITGYTDNNVSIYIRTPFNPYFTIEYNDEEITTDVIEQNHKYLLDETPIIKILKSKSGYNRYKFYTKDRNSYYTSLNFFKNNYPAPILDNYQSIVSKFFTDKNIVPGKWVRAFNLHTLKYTQETGHKYSTCEIELYANEVHNIDWNIAPKAGIIAFFDIETISHDEISFPDPESFQPPDNIFSISLVVKNTILDTLQLYIFILTDKTLPPKIHYDKFNIKQDVNIIVSVSEAELIISFFAVLKEIGPDIWVTMNGINFDINYIGTRSKILGINNRISNFTKIINYKPTFYQTTIYQKVPFPNVNEVYVINTPGIVQIDLLDVYRKLYNFFGNHKLDTISQYLLGRGKTGLSVKDMFYKYKYGNVEDLLEIMDYSINDSILLYDLWVKSNLDQELSEHVNFWRNIPEVVSASDMDSLFVDLIHDLVYREYNKMVNINQTLLNRYDVGKILETERKAGIHMGVNVYTLHEVYLKFLKELNTPLSDLIVQYFDNTDYGIIPFRSGYFNVKFDDVLAFIDEKIPKEQQIWVDDLSVAVNSKYPIDPIFKHTSTVHVIIASKSWIVINEEGFVFKKGLSALVRPPFLLLEKYIDYIVEYVKSNPQVVSRLNFPQLPSTIDDFVMKMKITKEDFLNPSAKKEPIIKQLRQFGISKTPTWITVNYIQTVDGPIIEQVYKTNIPKYSKLIDTKYYNNIINNVLKSINKNI